MSSLTVQKVQQWIRNHENELIENTQQLLRFKSIEGAPAPNAPFGTEIDNALQYMLNLSSNAGMKTKNLDGYAGWAEFGDGKPLIVSLGHLDVVPVGDGWKHPPFDAVIDNGYLYGRGVVDDKGPTMASFFAMRAIMECTKGLKVRFRAVYGCNEESGFECVERYVKTEEHPTYGIAPDSDWPLVHAEKGIADLQIEVPLVKGELALLSIEGGDRPNIVIDKCTAKLKVLQTRKEEVLEKIGNAWDKNISLTWLTDDTFEITAIGKAAHGSTPFYGDSAAIRLLRFIREISPASNWEEYTALLDICDISGYGLGIQGSDELSTLTANAGIINSDENNLYVLINIRYPVTWKGNDLVERCEAKLNESYPNFKIKVFRDSEPLHFPVDSPMVEAILSAYNAEAGGFSKPKVMGGGTYARAIPNTVSIGTSWAGDGEPHETDERLRVENLLRLSLYYARILLYLAALEIDIE